MFSNLGAKQFSLALTNLAIPGVAAANEGLPKLIANPDNWAMQNGNFANTRYSALSQFNP